MQPQFTVVDNSPQGRYKKLNQCIGSGSFKKVYRGFDTAQGKDIAWNEISVSGLPDKERDRFISEVEILKSLRNKYFIQYYSSWYDSSQDKIILITQIVTSGTLNNYIKGKKLSLKVIKRWSLQILEALNYLHTQNPPIIHRDLKCSNIFIDGTTSTIIIGDLGLSKRRDTSQMSIAGTPEFMAPEIFANGVYDEKVDIYAFGMCVLELITKKIPYSECKSIKDIYTKVTTGILPECLEDVKNEDAKAFIKKLISKAPARPSAGELLHDPFLTTIQPQDSDPIITDEADNAEVDIQKMLEQIPNETSKEVSSSVPSTNIETPAPKISTSSEHTAPIPEIVLKTPKETPAKSEVLEPSIQNEIGDTTKAVIECNSTVQKKPEIMVQTQLSDTSRVRPLNPSFSPTQTIHVSPNPIKSTTSFISNNLPSSPTPFISNNLPSSPTPFISSNLPSSPTPKFIEPSIPLHHHRLSISGSAGNLLSRQSACHERIYTGGTEAGLILRCYSSNPSTPTAARTMQHNGISTAFNNMGGQHDEETLKQPHIRVNSLQAISPPRPKILAETNSPVAGKNDNEFEKNSGTGLMDSISVGSCAERQDDVNMNSTLTIVFDPVLDEDGKPVKVDTINLVTKMDIVLINNTGNKCFFKVDSTCVNYENCNIIRSQNIEYMYGSSRPEEFVSQLVGNITVDEVSLDSIAAYFHKWIDKILRGIDSEERSYGTTPVTDEAL